MDRKIAIRMNEATFESLRGLFLSGKPGDEQFAFALASKVEGPETTIFLVQDILAPGEGDLVHQGPCGIELSRRYQTVVYNLAQMRGCSILDIHTHPFQAIPRFSAIDDTESKSNARFVGRAFEAPMTMGMIVFDQNLRAFDGRVWNRETQSFDEVERLEILGDSVRLIDRKPEEQDSIDERFDRHTRVQGWDQSRLERLKVLVIGAGGNGAHFIQGLASLGVGRSGGWIAICDNDVIEASNLPRIPYARPSDIGKPKTLVAKRRIRQRDPQIRTLSLPFAIADPRCARWTKEAHIIIGCLDRDSARNEVNHLAVRYGVPLIDVAAEIIPTEPVWKSGAQVRVFRPGKGACMVCGGWLDLSRGDPSTLNDGERALRASLGYIRDGEETPTPAVLDLNGIAAHLALSQLRRMVFGEPIDPTACLFYERETVSLIAGAMPAADPDCPVCGRQGVAAAGDPIEEPGANGDGDELLRITSRDTSGGEDESVSERDGLSNSHESLSLPGEGSAR